MKVKQVIVEAMQLRYNSVEMGNIYMYKLIFDKSSRYK